MSHVILLAVYWRDCCDKIDVEAMLSMSNAESWWLKEPLWVIPAQEKIPHTEP